MLQDFILYYLGPVPSVLLLVLVLLALMFGITALLIKYFDEL